MLPERREEMITAWAERTVIPTVVQWLDHFRV